MHRRFYCPLPILTLNIRKRKGETERQYGKRFEQFQKRLARILHMRIKIEEANERRII